MSGKYDDIINMPHHVSRTHKPMSAESRVAQFAPFAALTGYEEAITKTIHINQLEYETGSNDEDLDTE